MYFNKTKWWELQDLATKHGFDLRQELSDTLDGSNYFVLFSGQKVLAREQASSIGLTKIYDAIEALQQVPQSARSGSANGNIRRFLENAQQQMHLAYRFIFAIPHQQQTRAIADTALQLFWYNHQRTGDNCYRAQNYTISLQDKDIYRVTNSQGQILLSFRANNRKVQEVLGNQLSSFHYMDFARARSVVSGAGVETISPKSTQRIIQLGNLAPAGDKELLLTVRTQEVVKTVKDFLNTLGTSLWTAPNGNYSYQLADNGNLQIFSNLDGRQEILKLSKTEIKSNLEAKDFIYFAELKIELAKTIGKEKQPYIVNNTNTLSALLVAQKVMNLLNVNSYQDSSYTFLKKEESIIIYDKNSREELAKLNKNNEVSGVLNSQDLFYFQNLEPLLKFYPLELLVQPINNHLSTEIER